MFAAVAAAGVLTRYLTALMLTCNLQQCKCIQALQLTYYSDVFHVVLVSDVCRTHCTGISWQIC